MRIEIAQPIFGGAAIMLTAPPPVLLDGEVAVEMPDQAVTWHDPAGEEILRNPIGGVGVVETIRR